MFFLEFFAFSMIQWILAFWSLVPLVGNWISGSSLLCSFKTLYFYYPSLFLLLVYPPRHFLFLYMLIEYCFTKINLYFTYYFITCFLWLMISTFPWQYTLILYHTQFYKQISWKISQMIFTSGLFLETLFQKHIFHSVFMFLSCFHASKSFLTTFVDMT